MPESKAALRTLAVLALVALFLASLALWPESDRIPERRAPVEIPLLPDEPVVHRYK